MKFLAIALLFPMAPAVVAQPVTPVLQEVDRKAEYKTKRAEAEGDATKLWELYDWCEAYGLSREGRSVLRAIIEIDDARKAHELLGEIEYDGQWFASQAKVEAYKRKQLEAEAKASGKEIYNGELVDAEDLPFLERGLVKDENGNWLNREDYEKTQAGWSRQDLEWVPPDEAGKIGDGQYWCGDEWLDLEAADEYHSELGKWWRLEGEHYIVYSCAPRSVADRAIWEAETVYKDFERALGRTPEEKPMLLVLNSFEQYNEFAGNPDTIIELRGFSSLHGAFLAEAWPVPYEQGLNAGAVCYWNHKDPGEDAFGRTFARHAAGQAFAEALDPSPKALAAMMRQQGDPASAFWAEKQLPAWFRYGVATYGERYFVDGSVPENQGGPYGLRNWSIGNIMNKGGLSSLESLFAFELSLDDIPGSSKMINESGLLMAFILDGECKPVMAKHLALKDAFKKGEGVEKAAKALEQEIIKNETALRQFAGI